MKSHPVDVPLLIPIHLFIFSSSSFNLLQISRKGHSRVPVYEGSRENIVGLLFVKSLIVLDPEDGTPIKDIYKAGSFLTSPTSEPLFGLLDKFQTGKSKLLQFLRKGFV